MTTTLQPLETLHGKSDESGNTGTQTLGKYLYKRAGIQSTDTPGAELPETFDSSKISVEVDGAALVDVDVSTIDVGNHVITYTIPVTTKSVEVAMTIKG